MTQLVRHATALCKARDLLANLKIEDPSEIEVDHIAAFKGAPVRFADIQGCDGRLVRIGECGIITVRRSITSQGQIRFVIAHELGHFLMHPHIRQIDEVNTSQTKNWNHNQNPEELEANYFAAELLMPQRFFECDIRNKEPSWDLMKTLASRYRTTLTSAAIQYVAYTQEPVSLVASENGRRKWFASSTSQEFYVCEDSEIHPYSCARELLSGDNTRSHASNIPAGAWFRDFDPDAKDYITEDSVRARDSAFVLSLLWISEAI